MAGRRGSVHCHTPDQAWSSGVGGLGSPPPTDRGFGRYYSSHRQNPDTRQGFVFPNSRVQRCDWPVGRTRMQRFPLGLDGVLGCDYHRWGVGPICNSLTSDRCSLPPRRHPACGWVLSAGLPEHLPTDLPNKVPRPPNGQIAQPAKWFKVLVKAAANWYLDRFTRPQGRTGGRTIAVGNPSRGIRRLVPRHRATRGGPADRRSLPPTVRPCRCKALSGHLTPTITEHRPCM